MADATITFTTQNIGGDKYIRVDKKAVELTEGKTIEFKNSLTGKPDIDMQFFEVGSATPISGFCSGTNGDTFEVPGGSGGSADCMVTSGPTAVAYTAVTAPGTPPGLRHEELDPVIIITPAKNLSMQFLTSPPGIIAGVLVLVLLVVVFRVGVNTGLKKGARPAG